MSLISHRLFMPKLLLSENREVSMFRVALSAIAQRDVIGLDCLLQAAVVSLQVLVAVPEGCRP